MEQNNVNSHGVSAVRTPRVPFFELVSPVNHIAVELAELSTSAGSLVIRALAAIRRRHAINRTIRALRSLDDHILQDIGIDRSEIGSVAIAQVDGSRARG